MRPTSEHVAAIFSSHRYSRYRGEINHLLVRPNFTGYWVLQHSLERLKAPSESDITILYLHGGGYFSSQPAHYLLFLLRLVEPILKQGSSVSIFSLDYSLAPEHVFPKQLEEATAAYKYLISEEHISTEKLIVMGDSAGGHLALSLLVSLNNSRSSDVKDAALPKPGGLVLISPWLSLYHEPSSFTTNAHLDVLSGPFLRDTARRFLGPDSTSSNGPLKSTKNSPYLEFLTPDPTIDWEAVLPSWIWVSAGENEVLIDNVKLWVGILKERLGGERVTLEVGAQKVHVWQWLETMTDEPMKKAFLAGYVGDETGFEATANVGRAIVERVKRAQAVFDP